MVAWRGGICRNLFVRDARPSVAVALLAAGLAGCARVEEASPDALYLERTLLPQIVKWAYGDVPTLPLAPLVKGRGYDHICVVLAYRNLRDIPGKTGIEIERYHSAFGTSVPDGSAALVAVKDGDAHAARIDTGTIFLTVNPDVLCYQTSDAVLSRDFTPNYDLPIVGLGRAQEPQR